MKLEWVIGAVREIAALGGIGHLQDIRFGARGATKGRALVGSDVQRIADECVVRGLLRKKSKDTYVITDSGRRFLDEHRQEAHPSGQQS
jgi:hypothetical protein